jgi:hypothetical protein
MDAEVTHVEVERFVSPQRPSGCSTKMTGRYDRIIHFVLKVNQG